jgi:hypothetical protein
MPITHKTRFFTSAMANAPVMTTGAGGIIAVLDGCLLNGFNTKTLSSLSVTSGVATATVSGGHGYSQYVIIEISGSSISALNGTHRVATVPDSTTFTFEATGVANGTATGTITAIVATPTGWTKAFSGTNKAAYKSTTSASGFYFRIDDSGDYSTGQPVRGYESMSDVDTGTAPFPTTGQQSTFNWRRSQNSSGNRQWVLVADDKFFYLFVKNNDSVNNFAPMTFGDFSSFDELDDSACLLTAANVSTPSNVYFKPFSELGSITPSFSSTSKYVAREYGSSAGAIGAYAACTSFVGYSISIDGNILTDSACISGGWLISRSGFICDVGASKRLRGMFPGFYQSFIKPDGLMSNIFETVPIDGKIYIAVKVISYSYYMGDITESVLLDLGDWR